MQQVKIAVLSLCMVTTTATAGTGVTYGTAEARTGVITTDGMLGITAGMTHRQVAHLINRRGVYAESDVDGGTFRCNIYQMRNGLASVMVERGVVTQVTTDSPRLSTVSGARVGMSAVALRRLYGNRLIRRRGEENPLYYNYYLFSSNGNGIDFGVDPEGKIFGIAAGRRSSLEQGGGCV